MTTIKISIKNKRDADLLYRMLQKMPFIEKIEKTENRRLIELKNQFNVLKEILSLKGSPDLFKNISDPINWQRELRNEWE